MLLKKWYVNYNINYLNITVINITFQEEEYFELALKAYQNGSPNAATTGTCVILIIVKDDKIYVANCGDTQASLFSINKNTKSTKYNGRVLNKIHNASQIAERKRLKEEHSNEDDILLSRKGSDVYYVKGMLQCTRVILLITNQIINISLVNRRFILKTQRVQLSTY